MGKFFNQVIMPMRKIPLGKIRRKDSLEGLRTKFNEEQVETKQAPLYVSDKDRANAKSIHSTEGAETGIAPSTGIQQSQPRTDISARRSGQKRVRRIGKSVVAETRHYK